MFNTSMFVYKALNFGFPCDPGSGIMINYQKR
jgi:hypothetical protein